MWELNHQTGVFDYVDDFVDVNSTSGAKLGIAVAVSGNIVMASTSDFSIFDQYGDVWFLEVGLLRIKKKSGGCFG